ncbi:MAG: PRC-barrel domain-containing protein [Gammaproteobacteria bacterium]|nr:PRC-barrel domain-containing protein [Gammaproteobacteria bacterium]
MLIGCNHMVGQRLVNHIGEVLGTLHSIVLDVQTGNISYAVLAYPLSTVRRPRLFAVPWQALNFDPEHQDFSIEAEHQQLQQQTGFNRSLWPACADPQWQHKVDSFYQGHACHSVDSIAGVSA